MIGKLFINSLDAYSTYGLYVANGGYRGLISAPELKDVPINNWPDEDGIEADLSDPALGSKEFVIDFYTSGSMTAIIDALKSSVYHEFDFAEIGLVKTLRYLSCDGYREVGALKSLSIKFADDFPFEGYAYSLPQGEGVTGFELDDIDLGVYEFRILQGTRDEIRKPAPVKKNLTVSYQKINGVSYDDDSVYYDAKETTLKLHLCGDTTVFWSAYNALLYDLVRVGKRVLKHPDGLNDCFYKGCQAVEFAVTGDEIWCKLDLSLIFTMQPIQIIYILLSEDGEAMITEEGQLIQLL